MRRRLTASYTLLLMLVLVALELPLAITLASRETQRVAADRLGDAIRFANLAEPALRSGDSSDVSFELSRYRELYGIGAAVVDPDGHGVVTALGGSALRGFGLDSAPVRRQVRRALAGQQAGDDGTIWPWRSTPLVVAVPVGSGGEYYGAVVIVSPTRGLAGAVGFMWTVLFGGGVLVLIAGVVAAWSFARWTLRPVAELDSAVNHIGAGNYQIRVPVHRGPSELRRLANALNQMTVTVADLLDRQHAFVSDASHQLRNPLAALRLYVEELGPELTTAEAIETHRLALEEVQRLCQILDSLLALARAEGGHARLEPVDVGRCAQARVEAWRPLAQRREVLLNYVPPGRTVVVRTVPTALDQALDALIDNAVKFCSRGCEVVVRVEALLRPVTAVAVHVVDTGPGLTPGQRERALERFWRAPEVDEVQGSGLGLPIVSVLIEASGGRLDLLPVVPHGLDACIWLPVPADADANTATDAGAGTGAPDGLVRS